MPLFGTTSFPVDYTATLEALFLLKPATVIPGNGPVMRDTAQIKKILALLSSISKFVRRSRAASRAQQLRKSFNLSSHRESFADGSA